MRSLGRLRGGSLVAGIVVMFGVSLIVVPQANAAGVSEFGGTVHYGAFSGEVNRVTVSMDGADLTITEAGPGVTVQDFNGGDACTVAGRTVTCVGIERFNLQLADGDDRAVLTVDVPASISGEMFGGAGDDFLKGGAGDESIFGDSGSYPTAGGDDTINGSAGRDRLFGDQGSDTILGGLGRDVASGDTGVDDVNGQDGSDSVEGGGDADLVSGGNGLDTITGNGGADELHGGNEDDVLLADAGADLLDGGPDFDMVDYRERDDAVTVTIGASGANDGNFEDGPGGSRDEVLSTVEGVEGGLGPDRLFGDDADNELLGNGSGDFISAGGGNDGLAGQNGRDRLVGGDGTDSLEGGRDNDTLNSRDGARDADYCHGGTDTVAADAQDTVSGDCETVNVA